MNKVRKLLAVACVLAMLWFTTGCMQQIPPSSVGIKFNASTGIQESILTPQVVYVGWREHLFIYPTSIKNASYVRASKEGKQEGDDSIVATTVEGAQLPMDVTVAYHVDSDNMTAVFKEFGEQSLDDIQRYFIRYMTQHAVNAITGSRSIFDITAKDRKNLGPLIKNELKAMTDSYGISVDDVYVGEVYPPQAIADKIQEKIQKISELEKFKIQLERTRVEAQTQITTAEKEAAIAAIRAKQGDTAVQLRRLQIKMKAIAAWDGRPPLIGDRTVPFTDISFK